MQVQIMRTGKYFLCVDYCRSSSPVLKSLYVDRFKFSVSVHRHQLHLKDQFCVRRNSERARVKDNVADWKKKQQQFNIKGIYHRTKSKDTWSLGRPSFRKPTRVQSPVWLFHPCSLLEEPHPTVHYSTISKEATQKNIYIAFVYSPLWLLFQRQL